MDRSERVLSYLRKIAGSDPIESLALEADAVASSLPQGAGLESAGGPNPEKAAADIKAGLEAASRGKALNRAQASMLEAIVLPNHRPAIPLRNAAFEVTHRLWTHLNADEQRSRIWRWQASIGRVEVPGSGIPYGGTAFVVGPGLLMTNRHVAEIFAHGLGDRDIARVDGMRPGFNLAFAPDEGGATLRVKSVRLIHPYWDMAVLEVEGLPADAAVLPLSAADVAEADGKEVCAIGYPAHDWRNDGADQRKVFGGVFGVKQLQPGRLGGRIDVESFAKIVSSVGHDCSTLGGNSGCAVFNMGTGQIAGLHFGGRYLVGNYAVPISELARDARVWDAGVVFAGGGRPSMEPSWSGWWRMADGAEAATPASADDRPFGSARPALQLQTPPPPPPPSPPSSLSPSGMPPAPPPLRTGADGSVHLTVPLHITISLGQPGVGGAVGAPAVHARQAEIERLAEPFRDSDYSTRRGYDPAFLGLDAPMPQPVDARVLAPTIAGQTVLHYQNFSIMMHAKRRLALVTAANVTAAARLKRPEAGKAYGRKDLSGLGEDDQERWFLDPRMEARYQLPDVFYTRDDASFDKGHVIRREDVAWGETYALLRRANGDTYHVTNCSPQVAGFNRSSDGEDNWGDLENAVFAQASDERLALFAGPLLASDDPRFLGRMGGRERVLIQIPTRFWKVIVAKTTDGLGAYGFMLEQDLSDVDTREFAVPEPFRRSMLPLAEIGRLAGVTFDAALVEADQFDDRGVEVARRAGVRRRTG